MDIIGKKYIFLSISGILVLASLLAIAGWGLRLGIDFTGGSLLQVSFVSARPSLEAVHTAMDKLAIGAVAVESAGERDIIVRFRTVDETGHQEILHALGALGAAQEKQFITIGPTIGKELKNRALVALAIALALIVLYLTWAFRHVSRPLSSWKYGTIAVVVALFHDIIIPAGAFALLGRFAGAEADALFITALLTILGFSVHDTIVVFDRTRENLRTMKNTGSFEAIVNQSVNETLVRSLFTSLTVLLVLAVIFFFGGASTRYFAITLIIGVFFGTYSSIFIASPLLVMWNNFAKRLK